MTKEKRDTPYMRTRKSLLGRENLLEATCAAPLDIHRSPLMRYTLGLIPFTHILPRMHTCAHGLFHMSCVPLSLRILQPSFLVSQLPAVPKTSNKLEARNSGALGVRERLANAEKGDKCLEYENGQ